MNNAKGKSKSFIARMLRLESAVLIGLMFAWSWLFQIDIAELSDNYVTGMVIVCACFTVAAFLSWFIARISWRYFIPNKTRLNWLDILGLIAVWSLTELAIAWILNLITIGNGWSWDTLLPFSTLTPLVMMTPLGYLTRFVGFFGVSALVGTGLLLIYRKKWRTATIYWLIVFALTALSWLVYRDASGENIKAMIVADIPGGSAAANPQQEGFVLLPEYGLDKNVSESIPYDYSGTKEVQNGEARSNVLVYGSSQTEVLEEYPKSRLVVFGEYLPYFAELYLRTTDSKVYDDFIQNRRLLKGEPRYKTFKISEGVEAGNSACSGVGNPGDYRKLTMNGATFLANSASLGLFGGSEVFRVYHDGFVKFASVANARPFIQSATDWPAYALDHNGRQLESIEPIDTATVGITTNTMITPYSLLGEWVAVSGLGFVIAGVISRFKTRLLWK